MKPDLSVIIATFNRAKNLEKCLESLTCQSFSNFEVIIVDGGSTDNTKNVIKKFERKLKIKKIIFKKPQLAQVRDIGWRKAKSPIVAWIDDDVIVSKNWAKEIIDTFKKDKKIAGVSGPNIIPKKLLKNRDIFTFYQAKGIFSLLGKFWEKFFLEGKKYEPGKILKCGAWSPGANFPHCLKLKNPTEVDYLEACNMALRRDLVAKVGGFDFDFKGTAEWSELDLAIRIKKLGYRLVFNPKVRVTHFISQQGVYSRRKSAEERMENFFKFYFRHIFKPFPNYIFKFIIYLLFLNSYWLYKAIKTKNLSWLGGWLGSLRGLKYLYER